MPQRTLMSVRIKKQQRTSLPGSLTEMRHAIAAAAGADVAAWDRRITDADAGPEMRAGLTTVVEAAITRRVSRMPTRCSATQPQQLQHTQQRAQAARSSPAMLRQLAGRAATAAAAGGGARRSLHRSSLVCLAAKQVEVSCPHGCLVAGKEFVKEAIAR